MNQTHRFTAVFKIYMLDKKLTLVAMVTRLKIRKNEENHKCKNACFKHNLKLFFVAICEKHAKFLHHIYSSIIQHLKTAVAKEICGLKKIIQKFLIVQNVIATAIHFA